MLTKWKRLLFQTEWAIDSVSPPVVCVEDQQETFERGLIVTNGKILEFGDLILLLTKTGIISHVFLSLIFLFLSGNCNIYDKPMR